jgi:hypothetical protein
MRKHVYCWLVALLLASLLAGCGAPAAPEVTKEEVEVTRVVEKQVPVEVTRVVDKEVEVEVTRVVEKEAEAPPPAGETLYEAVWPRGKAAVKITPLAGRLDTLEGKTICELWDYMFRGDEVFPMLEEALAAKYAGIKFVNFAEFGRTHGGDEAEVIASFPEKFEEFGCDAVISAVGC